MNLLPAALLLFITDFYPAETLQISSKLDFGEKRLYSREETSSGRNERRRAISSASSPLTVNRQQENDKPMTLAIVCVSKSNNCNLGTKTIDSTKADVVVQVIADSGNEHSSNKTSVDVPDIPVVIGTKGVSYSSYANPTVMPPYNIPSTSRQSNRRPPITKKVYVPLFGSSVIETPVTSRNYRSTTVEGGYPFYNSYRSVNPYPYNNYNNRRKSYEDGPIPTQSYFGDLSFPSTSFQSTYNGELVPNWNQRSTSSMDEALVCTCENRSPHHHTPSLDLKDSAENSIVSASPRLRYHERDWRFFKKPAIDGKIAPLD